jgi:predicted HicB family RNase H-like nuclease
MTEPKKPGRPPLDPTDRVSTPVSLRMPSRLHEQACRMARAQHVSLPEAIRRAVKMASRGYIE